MGPGDPFGTSPQATRSSPKPVTAPPGTKTEDGATGADSSQAPPTDGSSWPDNLEVTMQAQGGDMSVDLTKLIIIIAGLLLGTVFGVVLVFAGGWKALAVFALALLGALVAWLVHAIMTGRLDFQAGWKALLRR